MDIEEMLYHADGLRRDGEIDEAISLYQRISALIKGDKELQYRYASRLYRQLCYCYRKIGKVSAAIDTGEKSIKSAIKTCLKYNQNKESRSALAYCYMNLGVVYDESMEYEKALQYYQVGADIFKNYIDEDSAIMNNYINAILSIGTSMFLMGKYVDSRKHFQHMIDCIGTNTGDARYSYAIKYLDMIYQKIGDETT